MLAVARAGVRHSGNDGQTPRVVFTPIEQNALIPLPPQPFESVV